LIFKARIHWGEIFEKQQNMIKLHEANQISLANRGTNLIFTGWF